MNLNEKASVMHLDSIESVNNSDNEQHHHGQHHLTKVNSANEEIIQHLQTTGEEVGMTFRSIMAALVSVVLLIC
jgi:hypothetical protein